MDAQTDASGAPNERRTIGGPLLEQAGFARGVRTVRAAPLRPIVGMKAGGADQHYDTKDESLPK
jgi:hypothetical protein